MTYDKKKKERTISCASANIKMFFWNEMQFIYSKVNKEKKAEHPQ